MGSRKFIIEIEDKTLWNSESYTEVDVLDLIQGSDCSVECESRNIGTIDIREIFVDNPAPTQ